MRGGNRSRVARYGIRIPQWGIWRLGLEIRETVDPPKRNPLQNPLILPIQSTDTDTRECRGHCEGGKERDSGLEVRAACSLPGTCHCLSGIDSFCRWFNGPFKFLLVTFHSSDITLFGNRVIGLLKFLLFACHTSQVTLHLSLVTCHSPLLFQGSRSGVESS